MTDYVKIENCALDEWSGTVVLRGTIVPTTFELLKVDDYQREVLSASKIDNLVTAMRAGQRVPDVELGMRGEDYLQEDGGVILLRDPAYIVDGLQRISAAKKLMMLEPGMLPHIGATIHFNTTLEWERERFRVLNLTQTKLSPNITLRNARHGNVAAELLYKQTTDPRSKWILTGKVCWSQQMKRGDLITASVLFKTVGMLHGHVGPGRSTNVVDLSQGLLKIMETIGRNPFVNNTRYFFDLIDEFWGVRSVAYRDGAIQLKLGFMLALAKLFSEHTDFWDGNKLVLDDANKKKLSQFPVTDPHIAQLAGGTSNSVNMLMRHMADHLDAGRRTKRLTPRRWDEDIANTTIETLDEDEA